MTAEPAFIEDVENELLNFTILNHYNSQGHFF